MVQGYSNQIVCSEATLYFFNKYIYPDIVVQVIWKYMYSLAQKSDRLPYFIL